MSELYRLQSFLETLLERNGRLVLLALHKGDIEHCGARCSDGSV